MNSISISGSLGKDGELRKLSDGTAVLSFSVADSYVQGGDKHTLWWNCSLFGKRADSLQQYLTKGQAVTVIGSVTEREYTNKDGQKVKSTDVRVNDVALQGGKRDAAPSPAPSAPAQRPAASRPANGFDDMDDGSDVPF